VNFELSRLRKARKCIFGLCGWKSTGLVSLTVEREFSK